MHHSYGERFTLVYLWRRLPGSVGNANAGEVECFAELVQAEISFVPVTVGELIDHFEPDTGSQAWFDDMTERSSTSLTSIDGPAWPASNEPKPIRRPVALDTLVPATPERSTPVSPPVRLDLVR